MIVERLTRDVMEHRSSASAPVAACRKRRWIWEQRKRAGLAGLARWFQATVITPYSWVQPLSVPGIVAPIVTISRLPAVAPLPGVTSQTK